MASVESFRPYVEAPAPVPPQPPPQTQLFVYDEPKVRELTPIELVHHVRGYVAVVLALIAVFLLLRLAATLWQRYRLENVSPVTKMAPDRASLRKKTLP